MNSIKILRATKDMISEIRDLINNGYLSPYKEDGLVSKPFFLRLMRMRLLPAR